MSSEESGQLRRTAAGPLRNARLHLPPLQQSPPRDRDPPAVASPSGPPGSPAATARRPLSGRPPNHRRGVSTCRRSALGTVPMEERRGALTGVVRSDPPLVLSAWSGLVQHLPKPAEQAYQTYEPRHHPVVSTTSSNTAPFPPDCCRSGSPPPPPWHRLVTQSGLARPRHARTTLPLVPDPRRLEGPVPAGVRLLSCNLRNDLAARGPGSAATKSACSSRQSAAATFHGQPQATTAARTRAPATAPPGSPQDNLQGGPPRSRRRAYQAELRGPKRRPRLRKPLRA